MIATFMALAAMTTADCGLQTADGFHIRYSICESPELLRTANCELRTASFSSFQSPVSSPPQEPAPITKVNLSRKYTKGETQAYTASYTVKSTGGGADVEMKASAEFTRVVQEVSDSGAKIETEYKSAKMTFGGQEVPGQELPPKKTRDYDKSGMPKEMDNSEDADPMSIIVPAFYLPAKEIEIGKTYEIKWSADGDKVKMEGEGKLIATGMLYEEHVSKVTVTVTVTPKEDSPAKFEMTCYYNTDTGKLVKSEGTISSKDENLGGEFNATFVIAKVRSK